MKSVLLIADVILSLAFWYQASVGIEVKGGIMEDVVVADSGISEYTIQTEFLGGWLPKGPNSFDIDTSCNIYILDRLGYKILKYDKNGNLVHSIPIRVEGQGQIDAPELYDIAVDDDGEIYVLGDFRKITIEGREVRRRGLMRFSRDGKFLSQIPSKENEGKGYFKYGMSEFIVTDKHGNIINFGLSFQEPIDIYTSEGEHQATINYDHEYRDIGISQKAAGDDIYFRSTKYLMRTSPEDFLKTGKPETVVVLPDKLRLVKYRENKYREEGLVEYPVVLIGYDKNKCFYFHQPEYWYNERGREVCLIHRIYKFKLEEKQLLLDGMIEIEFQKGQEECSDKELFDFAKQFIVMGDGTIYFLHGTVDKIKVSKITMEESKNGE
ncbi:MAG: hypothetical protein ABII96_07640 [Candidatus Zixiibacteriota bacterium]